MSNDTYDKKSELIKKLERFGAQHTDRQAIVQRMIHFIQNTPECFERDNPTGHITGSAWLLNPEGDKALMTHHRKLKRWLQPGGHADGQKDTLAVAIREANEESGISCITAISDEIFDIDIHLIPSRPGEAEHFHYDIRYLLRAPHENFTISEESDALEWWSSADFAKRQHQTDEAVLRMAAIFPGIQSSNSANENQSR